MKVVCKPAQMSFSLWQQTFYVKFYSELLRISITQIAVILNFFVFWIMKLNIYKKYFYLFQMGIAFIFGYIDC